jgi:hypothetical protein
VRENFGVAVQHRWNTLSKRVARDRIFARRKNIFQKVFQNAVQLLSCKTFAIFKHEDWFFHIKQIFA